MDNILKAFEENIKEFKKYKKCEDEDIVILINFKAFSVIRKNINALITFSTGIKDNLTINGISTEIKDDLPENVDFLIKLKKDYEREQEFRRKYERFTRN